MEENTVFNTLSKIDLSDRTKTKMGLNYLSWAYAWQTLKETYPDATYKIYTRNVAMEEKIEVKSQDGSTQTTTVQSSNEVLYFTDGRTCWVKVGVTIKGIEYVEYLPVMDMKNNAVRAEVVTSTAVNRALQRAFVKACARHGLGLYIYAGEDLPTESKENIAVNIRDIITKADACKAIELDEKAFEEMKQYVISAVQKPRKEEINKAIFNYVTDLLPGKKLSTLTIEDSTSLQKLNCFFKELDK